MIEMQCPACGAEGRIPSEKVNTRLICRKCLKVFHMTPSGRAVPGEPLAASASAARGSHEPDPTQEVDQWFEKLGQRLSSPRTLLTAAALILAMITLGWLSTRKPETLEERVTKVATAAVLGDLQTIRSMSASGTDDEAVRWYDTIRSRCDSLRQRLGTHKLKVDVTVRHQDEEAGTSDVLARLESEESLERRGSSIPDPTVVVPAAASESVPLPMIWKSEGWTGWKLDGEKTLELAGSPS
ncbi:MAG: hypothetical protein U0790_19135 [Isosphaeraceae bacterium]